MPLMLMSTPPGLYCVPACFSYLFVDFLLWFSSVRPSGSIATAYITIITVISTHMHVYATQLYFPVRFSALLLQFRGGFSIFSFYTITAIFSCLYLCSLFFLCVFSFLLSFRFGYCFRLDMFPWGFFSVAAFCLCFSVVIWLCCMLLFELYSLHLQKT